ncbi:MAG: YciI family protein [Reichenbachiella sp.]
MKDFMMIFIGAPYEELGLSPEQLQAQMGKWFAWSEKMQSQGILKGGEALVAKAKRISSDRTVSDGPFVEGKELVGGYFTVSAKDADEVVKIAQDYPDYELGGTVEIREVIVFDH